MTYYQLLVVFETERCTFFIGIGRRTDLRILGVFDHVLVLIGRPGSGKGELSKRLTRQIGYIFTTASQVIEEHGTEEQKKLKREGRLIPDLEINKLMLDHAPRHSRGAYYGFDGYPRTALQTKGLLALVGEKYGSCRIITIFLDVPEEVASARLSSRGREDDTLGIVNMRNVDFKKNAGQVLGMLESNTHFCHIDGMTNNGGSRREKTPEEILDEVMDFLHTVLALPTTEELTAKAYPYEGGLELVPRLV